MFGSVLKTKGPALLLALFLSACGDEQPEESLQLPAERVAPRVRNVPDPAMVRDEEPQGSVEQQAAVAEPAAESEVPPEPTGFTVDMEGSRVFLPGKGWLEASEFWDIYYNRPQELPGNIDHQALQLLRAEKEAE